MTVIGRRLPSQARLSKAGKQSQEMSRCLSDHLKYSMRKGYYRRVCLTTPKVILIKLGETIYKWLHLNGCSLLK